MEQRRLRLGDTLDDYCPRERRLTNHAVVAMIEEDIKQTRCTTCDAEHAYKGGKVPKRKKKDTPSALYKDVLAGMPETDAPMLASHGAPAATPIAPAHKVSSAVAEMHAPIADGDEPESLESPTHVTSDAEQPEPAGGQRALHAESAVAPPLEAPDPLNTIEPPLQEERDLAASSVDAESSEPVEDGPVHRPLIRATLPRVEGFKEERRLPEFTIRQANGRGGNGHFRGADNRMKPRGAAGAGQGSGGNRPHGGPRFAGSRPPQPGRGPAGRGGPPAGFRGGQQRPGGGSRKRSR